MHTTRSLIEDPEIQPKEIYFNSKEVYVVGRYLWIDIAFSKKIFLIGLYKSVNGRLEL